jgi:hypothetical protein
MSPRQKRPMPDRLFSQVREAALLVACLFALGNSAVARIPPSSRAPTVPRLISKIRNPHPWIPIGKETTRVTGPVGDDGYIEHLAAMNAAASEGVTAENNAAVLLLRAIDLSSIPASDRERLCKTLGIEPSQGSAGLFQDNAAFLTNQGDRFGETISSMVPWSPAEFPPRAKWLKNHEEALDLAIEATRRPRFYIPLIRPPVTGSEPGELWDVPLYGLQAANEIARAFAARALLRIHDGKIAEAEQDFLACHRLARLVASGPFLLHGTVGRAIEIKACLAEAALLQYGKLSAADALAYRAELQKLPPLPSVAHHLGHGDRLMILGFATELAQKQQPELEDMALSIAPFANPEFLIDLLTDQMTVIWSEGMRSLNKEWDRWVAVAATPRLGGRLQQLEKLEQEARPVLNQKPEALSNAPLVERGRWMGRMLADRLMPAFKPALLIEDRVRMRVDLIQLGLALAAYKADVGTYPPTLKALAPKYCREADVPADRFTAKPLVYRPQAEAYQLSSTGDNGVDDGGRTSDSQPPGDDIVIQVVVKRQIEDSLGASTGWLQFAGLLLGAAALGGLTLVGIWLTKRRSSPGTADS